MPASKRGAPSASAPEFKRRKKKDEKKWYAVRVGARPGVYETWSECQKLTTGYPGAQYKSFLSRDEAQAYLEGKEIPSKSDAPEKPRFYAVARGNFTGIFQSWDHAQKACVGTKGPKYKKFDTRREAVDFINEWGDEETKAKVQAEQAALGDSEQEDEVVTEPIFKGRTVFTQGKVFKALDSDASNIFTDGSSLGNGQVGAIAGIGVWFGHKDPRNVSEPLEGTHKEQTNQRAELTAILRALQLTPPTEAAQIVTDSIYSINCITQWHINWQKHHWVTLEKKPVLHRDVIQAIRQKIEEREAECTRTDFAWAKGHSNTPGNIEADKLAVAGAMKALQAREVEAREVEALEVEAREVEARKVEARKVEARKMEVPMEAPKVKANSSRKRGKK